MTNSFTRLLSLAGGYLLLVGGVSLYLHRSSGDLVRSRVSWPGGQAWIWHGGTHTYPCPPPEAWIQAMAHTRHTADLALYRLNHSELLEAVRAMARRGVRVRLVTDAGETRALRQKLRRAGISLTVRPPGGLMHHKFAVLDGQVVLLGTANWTPGGLCRDANLTVMLTHRGLARVLQREMEEMAQAHRFGPSSLPEPPETLLVAGDTVVVLFSPDAGMPHPLLRWMMETRRELRVLAASLTDARVAQTLVMLHRMGRRVQVLAEGQEPQGSRLKMLEKAGIPVCREHSPALMHHKTMVRDSVWVWTGSYNFSRSAAQRNDEDVLVIRSPQLARAVLKELHTLWRASNCTSLSSNP